jgi:diguanylate cyclase (GGDEF)-like protein/PAS domain S-box-containing protein
MGAPASGDGAALGAAVARIATQLAEGAAWEPTVQAALADVGRGARVGRVLLFQNVRDPDGRLWMDLRCEWNAAGVRQLFEDPRNHLHPYFPDFGRWIDLLGSGKTISARADQLPDAERQVFGAEGTDGVLAVPIFSGAEWWGFVSFDDCGTPGAWGTEHESGLRLLADAIGEAVRRERLDEDLRFQEDRYRSMVENGPAVTYIDGVDDTASTLFISPQVHSLLGYSPEEWLAQPDLWPRILHPDDRARAVAENDRHNETGDPFRLEYRMFAKDGRVVWVRDEATMVRDERGMPRYSHGVIMDISERKRTEEEVAFRAYHDELTGLPSRAMFEELLDLSVARARRHDGAVAVLCVDLDDFRLVNDSLGHQHGDALLRLVSERLREATRETDLVARRGGDQFLLLLGDLDIGDGGEMEAAVIRSEAVAQRIQESLVAPFVLDATELYVSASIGISLFPQDGQDAGSLQRNAEAAMYDAKKSGSGYVMSAHGSYDSAAKLAFVTRLRKAVESQRWTLYYQPIVELESGRMTGVEALIRWIEPDGTMVPPNDFIPLAEELGLIESIGDWVVRELIYQVQAWSELDMDLEVGFNLSPRQFWQPDLAEKIVSQIQAGGIDAGRVLVEVTESSAMMDPDRAQKILEELAQAGLSIAIDDFGTGYSSLSRLRDMPVRVLKIDRTFVENVHRDPQSASIVSAFLELSKGLGMTTLAEGIETEEELAFLRERGCTLGQGFLFSKPVPPEEIIAYAFGGIPAAAALRSA